MGQGGASPYSSNSSIDGRVSPSPSFATSTHDVSSLSLPFVLPNSGSVDALWLELIIPVPGAWIRL